MSSSLSRLKFTNPFYFNGLPALVWQLMRAYTLSVLSQLANTGNPIIEKEIVQWVNQKLASAGKTTSIRSFQDQSISNAKVVIDLVDSIKEGSVNYDVVKDGADDEVSFCFLRIRDQRIFIGS